MFVIVIIAKYNAVNYFCNNISLNIQVILHRTTILFLFNFRKYVLL